MSAILVFLIVPSDTRKRQGEQIDYNGIFILSMAILSLLYVLDAGADWGWDSLPIMGLFVASKEVLKCLM